MLIFGDSQKYPDDSAESFIVENLSPYCVLWLSRQSDALGQTRTVILQQILKEWLATHAGDVPDDFDVHVPEIAREAVSEFILGHQEEFLPVHLVK
jgi:hypothetical protein